ncbi:MAG TPA: TIGR03663 family protein [Candidatus Hydrogenedens sp.]|nr:TIGR03663 family protein [Candidatus Hydrogenedens sp.]
MYKKKIPKYLFLLFYILFLFSVLVSRFYGISIRPMHCDEANQAYKAGILLEKGLYKYDPHEHHGPLLYYATLPIFYFYGVHQFRETNETMFRIVPVLFSILIFLSLLPMKKYVGLIAFLVSSILLAVSHAFFFYSRYYVHETLFVLFSSLFIFSLWGYISKPNILSAILTGFNLSLAFATKETTLIVLFATSLATVITFVYLIKTSQFMETNSTIFPHVLTWTKILKHIFALFIAFFIPWLLLFSSFFTNKQGLLDFFRAYQTYLFRASGEGSSGIHDKPWWYYLQILTYFNKTVGPIWSEGFIILLCSVGIIISLCFTIGILIKKKCDVREQTLSSFYIFLFVSFFTTFLIFSLIPYKTPWNILFPLLGMIIFAGIGFQALWQKFRKIWARFILSIILLSGIYHLSYQTYQGNFIYFADISNPYVYAHTSTSLVKMMDRIYQLSDILIKENQEPIVFVIDPINDYWPIPWYLRKIDKKGFWSKIPSNIENIPFLIVSPELLQEFDKRLNKPYMKEIYTIRPGVFRYLYIEQPLWDKFIEIQSIRKQ